MAARKFRFDELGSLREDLRQLVDATNSRHLKFQLKVCDRTKALTSKSGLIIKL